MMIEIVLLSTQSFTFQGDSFSNRNELITRITLNFLDKRACVTFLII